MFVVLLDVEVVVQGWVALARSQAGRQAERCFAGQAGDAREQVSSAGSMSDRSQDAGERQRPSPQRGKGLHEGVSGEGVWQEALEKT